jgi:hypothetical protein
MGKIKGRKDGSRRPNIGLAVLAVVVAGLLAFAMKPVAPDRSAAETINHAARSSTASADRQHISVVVARLQQAQAEGRPPVVSVIGSSLVESPNVPKFEDQ